MPSPDRQEGVSATAPLAEPDPITREEGCPRLDGSGDAGCCCLATTGPVVTSKLRCEMPSPDSAMRMLVEGCTGIEAR